MGWVVNDTPRPLYPRKRRYTLYRRLGAADNDILKNVVKVQIQDYRVYGPVYGHVLKTDKYRNL
jgi:hypothetical protein